jgi:UDP-galactopyranose mutase
VWHGDCSFENARFARGYEELHLLDPLPVIVFSHLRWDSVFQRPHHLVTRLARTRPVLFVEEPVPAEGGVPDSWDLQFPQPRLVVCRPVIEDSGYGFEQAPLPVLQKMTGQLLHWQGVRDHLAWLYTPLAHPVARALEPTLTVYDCMDELSAFLGAPRELLARREAELLRDASVVFTGGPSLYRAKRPLHPNVHCFPSSVDAGHFRRARQLAEADDQAHLPGLRLGFYGVIDERLDRELLDALAGSHPEWQIVLVGPVAKIDPATLPRRANLHYLGPRDYCDLPAYLAGWDACLLPFALNGATRYLSPTKTLEYMAAERPIVTTPIPDVVDAYAEIVHVGEGPAGFVAACERALAEGGALRAARVRRMREVLRRTSWDATLERMLREAERAAGRASRPALRLRDGLGLRAAASGIEA